MSGVNARELAEHLRVTPPRISQLLSEGKLEGCYHGIGRARRFDLVACAEALGRRINPGQRLGNGAETQRAAAAILAGRLGGAGEDVQVRPPAPTAEPSAPPAPPENRYEAARTIKAEEEARTARRRNLEAEGLFVLASEVEQQVRGQIGREIAETQNFLRALARVVADAHQLDAKVLRKLMLDEWRRHRSARAGAGDLVELDAMLSDAEGEADI